MTTHLRRRNETIALDVNWLRLTEMLVALRQLGPRARRQLSQQGKTFEIACHYVSNHRDCQLEALRGASDRNFGRFTRLIDLYHRTSVLLQRLDSFSSFTDNSPNHRPRAVDNSLLPLHFCDLNLERRRRTFLHKREARAFTPAICLIVVCE